MRSASGQEGPVVELFGVLLGQLQGDPDSPPLRIKATSSGLWATTVDGRLFTQLGWGHVRPFSFTDLMTPGLVVDGFWLLKLEVPENALPAWKLLLRRSTGFIGQNPEDGSTVYLVSSDVSRVVCGDRQATIFDMHPDDVTLAYALNRLFGRTVGVDPRTGLTISVQEGRYGQYVTDGKTNVSVRHPDTFESIDVERASELLQARRDRLLDQRKPPPEQHHDNRLGPSNPDLDLPVEVLDLPLVPRTALRRAKLRTIRQLIEFSAPQLVRSTDVEQRDLEVITEQLREMGLSLRPSEG